MNAGPRILLFTGDGKGKTTAALGMALRAMGHNIPVAIIQFIKGDDSTGEAILLGRMENVRLILAGLGFLPAAGAPRFANHKSAAEDGLEQAARIIESGEWPVVILDEVCNAVAHGLLEEEAVIDAVRLAKAGQCIVLTGRGATAGLLGLADTATEMRCIKHGMSSGVAAQKGVEL